MLLKSNPANTIIQSSLSRPLVNFLILGFVIFCGWRLLFAQLLTQSAEPLYLQSGFVDEQISQWQRQFRQKPGPAQLQALVKQQIEDQVLFTEALKQGFNELPVVQRRLEQLAKLLVSEQQPGVKQVLNETAFNLLRTDSTIRNTMINAIKSTLRSRQQISQPSEAEIRQYYQRHQTAFMSSEMRKISHVFVADLSSDGRALSNSLLQRIKAEEPAVITAIGYGDIFYGGHQLAHKTREQLANIFGKTFARTVWGLKARQWSQPIASAYGWHLVQVDQIMERQLIPFQEAGSTIENMLIRQASDRALEDAVAELLRRYQVILPGKYQDAIVDSGLSHEN